MKTQMNLDKSITGNSIKNTLYALQVIIIAMAIPLLSYMEMTHVEKAEKPSTKSSNLTIEKTDGTVFTLK